MLDDRRGDMSPAVGIVVGVVSSVALVAMIAAFGDYALHAMAWTVLTFVEGLR